MRHIGLLLPAAIGYVLIPMTDPIALNAKVPSCSNAEVLSNLSDVIWKTNTQMELLAKIGLPREQVAKFSFTDIRPTPLYPPLFYRFSSLFSFFFSCVLLCLYRGGPRAGCSWVFCGAPPPSSLCLC